MTRACAISSAVLATALLSTPTLVGAQVAGTTLVGIVTPTPIHSLAYPLDQIVSVHGLLKEVVRPILIAATAVGMSLRPEITMMGTG
jgi:hypothetical protein